jgi:AmpD protein
MQSQVDISTGLISGVEFRPSPHHDERPAGTAIDLLVLHGASLPAGEFGGPWIEQLFLGQLSKDAHPSFKDIAGLRVAPHLLIRRDGSLVQFVPFHKRAWHAGVSNYQGREACNDFSIGIEIEGTDVTPYAAPQYSALACVSAALIQAYPITTARIVGHSDIAPGRKTDPGPAFDWARYRDILASQPRAGSTTQP